MNHQEAAALIMMAVTVIPNYQEKDLVPTAMAWAVIMPDLDYQTAQAALVRIMREKKYATLPLPSEVLEAAREIRRQPTDPPLAIEAWEEVRKQLDPYKAPKYSHPLIQKAVQVIGLRTICEAEYDLSTRFMKIYDDLVRRDQIDQENKIAIQITAGGKINLLGGRSQWKHLANPETAAAAIGN